MSNSVFLIGITCAHGLLECKTLFTRSLLGGFGTYVRLVIIRPSFPLPQTNSTMFTCLPRKKNHPLVGDYKGESLVEDLNLYERCVAA